jgi:hypothetical protein
MKNTLKLYEGLKALSDAAFPKQCPSCGRRYESAEEFIRATQSIREGISGLKSAVDEEAQPMVELYRNCPCGSTLMDCFDDRRDLSQPGLKRRKLFGQLLGMLHRKGVQTHIARAELIRLMRGEQSPVLYEIGIKTKKL